MGRKKKEEGRKFWFICKDGQKVLIYADDEMKAANEFCKFFPNTPLEKVFEDVD